MRGFYVNIHSSVIMVTDEWEQSYYPIPDMINQMVAKKGGNPDHVKMTAIYNPNDDGGSRYYNAATSTGGFCLILQSKQQ